MKACSICGKILSESNFNKCSRRKDGLKKVCRECQSASAARYYERNREAIKARVLKVQREKREGGVS